MIGRLSLLQAVLTLLLLLAGCTSGVQKPEVTPEPAQPTPAPARPPMARSGGPGATTTFHLPGRVLSLSLAAHPAGDWAAVAITQRFTLASDPIAAFVQTQDPATGLWRDAVQLDTGATRLGMRTGGTAVAVTGDGTVVAAWGGSAADDGGVWVRAGHDNSAAWGPPERIAASSSTVLDAAASAGGWVVVLASGFERRGGVATPRTTLAVRAPDGAWQPAQTLDLPASFGAVVISGEGADARAVALIGTKDERTATILTRRLVEGGAWRMQQRSITLPPDADGEPDFFWRFRGVSFARAQAGATPQPGVVFVWTRRYHGDVFALVSLDGGQTWGPIEQVRRHAGDQIVAAAAPAYDPASDRLLVLYTCCTDQHETSPAVHYATWSTPRSGVWTEGATPLVLQDRAAEQTVIAQPLNRREIWVAWVEESQRVEVRRWPIDLLLGTGVGRRSSHSA